MAYYTDNNEIKEVVSRVADVEMRDLGSMESLTGTTVFLFDNLFLEVPIAPVSTELILCRRPLWGGNKILELMKRNDRVYLFCGEWCCVLPREKETENDFKFVPCKDPGLVGERICLLCPDHLDYKSRYAIQDLMEPVRFGQALASRLKEQSCDVRLESLLTIDRGDYRDICCKLETLASEVIHQRNMWKDRFFYKALNEDPGALCKACKEDMRLTFYVNENEEAALNWRPGQCKECHGCNCRLYSWESYEDESLENHIPVDEFVSSDEEDVCR